MWADIKVGIPCGVIIITVLAFIGFIGVATVGSDIYLISISGTETGDLCDADYSSYAFVINIQLYTDPNKRIVTFKVHGGEYPDARFVLTMAEMQKYRICEHKKKKEPITLYYSCEYHSPTNKRGMTEYYFERQPKTYDTGQLFLVGMLITLFGFMACLISCCGLTCCCRGANRLHETLAKKEREARPPPKGDPDEGWCFRELEKEET